jgi:hypothetical protein
MKTLNSNQSQRPITRRNRVPASLIAAGFLGALSVVCPAAAQSPSAPMLTIMEPAFNSTVQNATVPVTIQLLRAVDASTLQAQIDGNDISSRFTLGACTYTSCSYQATLQTADVVQGTNVLSFSVADPDGAAEADQTKFEFAGPAGQGTVNHLIPAVAVRSVNLPGGADQNDFKNYQIVVGPGPGFAPRTYTPAGLTCSAGINSMQALVLLRKTLSPEPKVGNGSGQACFGDAASLTTFLKGLPAGDLVIANSFLGVMPNLDTTAIGGTRYAGTAVSPYYYSVIGVAGAAAGSAWESYQPSRRGASWLAPLVGSLMLDIKQNYFFVPSSYPEIKIVPNDPATPLSSSITYNGHKYQFPFSGNDSGGFVVLAIDKRTGAVTDSYMFATNTASDAQSKKMVGDLTYLLDTTHNWTPDDLLFLTTVGTPFKAASYATEGLVAAIQRRGGNGYLLPKLLTPISTYTLITSTDPDYVREHHTLEVTSVRGDNESGEVDVLLGKDRKNRYELKDGLADQYIGNTQGAGWRQVMFQQPQDWPAWSSAEWAAYLDLTASTGHYPTVRQGLGCGRATDICQPIRNYYDGGMSAGAPPAVLSLTYSDPYFQNSAYTAEDLKVVTDQLKTEAGYEKNVYTLYGLFRDITTDQTGNWQLQLKRVAATLDSSLYNKDAHVTVDNLNTAAAVAGALRAVPSVGPAFGAVSALLAGVADLTPTGPTVPSDGKYGYTLKQLNDKSDSVGTDLANTITTIFTGVVNDWGKMSVIGSGYAGHQSPWYMSVSGEGSNVPRAALPVMALGAKRQFYLQLLPTVYTNDIFLSEKKSDPASIGGRVYAGDGLTSCVTVYDTAPASSHWAYSNIATPANWDIFVLNAIKTDKTYFGYYKRYFPSTSLLNDLFGDPDVTGTLLGGGAGFTQDQMMPSGSYLSSRKGEIPNGLKCAL